MIYLIGLISTFFVTRFIDFKKLRSYITERIIAVLEWIRAQFPHWWQSAKSDFVIAVSQLKPPVTSRRHKMAIWIVIATHCLMAAYLVPVLVGISCLIFLVALAGEASLFTFLMLLLFFGVVGCMFLFYWGTAKRLAKENGLDVSIRMHA